jgi:hypothetical protein
MLRTKEGEKGISLHLGKRPGNPLLVHFWQLSDESPVLTFISDFTLERAV